MKRSIVVVIMVLALLITLCGQALAQTTNQQKVDASFSVAEVINLTITDIGTSGLQFGPVTPGTNGNPDLGMILPDTPSLTLELGLETNVTCNITLRGDDFTSAVGERTAPIESVRWNTSGLYVVANQVTETEQTVISGLTKASAAAGLWHWLSLPANVVPGTYTGSVYYKAVAQ